MSEQKNDFEPVAELVALDSICDEIFERWDKDMRPGKLLSALGGRLPGYRGDVEKIRAALSTIATLTAERDAGIAPDHLIERILANDTPIGPEDQDSLKLFRDATDRAKAHLAETEADDGEWWLTVAKLAGEHGIRYRTNRSLQAFLKALPEQP